LLTTEIEKREREERQPAKQPSEEWRALGKRVAVHVPDWAVYRVGNAPPFDIRTRKQAIAAIRYMFETKGATTEESACLTSEVMRHVRKGSKRQQRHETQKLHTIFGAKNSAGWRLYKAIVRPKDKKCWLEVD
jgi:hypothetical protein